VMAEIRGSSAQSHSMSGSARARIEAGMRFGRYERANTPKRPSGGASRIRIALLYRVPLPGQEQPTGPSDVNTRLLSQ
jgi:hypothetical protein